MPHVSIKHFPAELSEAQRSELIAEITRAVRSAFGCDEGVVSIALEPVDPDLWNERVYQPEIVGHRDLLCKRPNY
ncbi:tautomerase PptA [Actinoplanes sp. NPDC049118]|uniref:tautomerase PptA n=1 Tax=Actinoplanes sp. NPDC049118 TaxID=3155769 RepID=UPI0033CE2CAC